MATLAWWDAFEAMLSRCIACNQPSTIRIQHMALGGRPMYGYCAYHADLCTARFFAGETRWNRLTMRYKEDY